MVTLKTTNCLNARGFKGAEWNYFSSEEILSDPAAPKNWSRFLFSGSLQTTSLYAAFARIKTNQ
jgi:hypothetical protein